MKAMVYTEYGSPDVLELKEIDKPTPKDNEVLIKVHATSVNASDWEFLRGKPLYARIIGLQKPKKTILGSDIAGVVSAVGRNVAKFKPGDEVFGDILDHLGGFAEYVCAPENALVHKPASMTFEQVAALPQAAVIALQGIRDKGQLQPGHKILINGAGGGGGTFAVQLAKLFGAEVTGVDNASKLDMLRSIGADHVIDYRQENFTTNGQRYDFILDLVAYRSVFDYQRALSPKGKYYMVGGSMGTISQILLMSPFIQLATSKKIRILAVQANSKDLLYMTELFETGKITPVIDRHYPLSELPAALRYLGEGHAKGKVIITMA